MKLFGLVLFAVVHGYFAAWLAVWMLFRPRKPLFIGGHQLPFTPGLLPASRGQLEDSIADSVASQVLRPEILQESAIRQGIPRVIRGALPEQIDQMGEDPEFQEILSQGVAESVKSYLRSKNGMKAEIEQNALVKYSAGFNFSWDAILAGLLRQVEEAVDRIVRTEKFRGGTKNALGRIADDLRKDDSALSVKIETVSGRILGAGITALDLRGIIKERLAALTDEELENLVQKTAGRHLQSIKYVAAAIGVLFGFISLVLFG
ncbi:MAG: DUF445 family protein [Candidatus Riflebacteria bacterium]|nr:DUF445 family protein [Candidatus Riflebacteria bacterium]